MAGAREPFLARPGVIGPELFFRDVVLGDIDGSAVRAELEKNAASAAGRQLALSFLGPGRYIPARKCVALPLRADVLGGEEGASVRRERDQTFSRSVQGVEYLVGVGVPEEHRGVIPRGQHFSV